MSKALESMSKEDQAVARFQLDPLNEAEYLFVLRHWAMHRSFRPIAEALGGPDVLVNEGYCVAKTRLVRALAARGEEFDSSTCYHWTSNEADPLTKTAFGNLFKNIGRDTHRSGGGDLICVDTPINYAEQGADDYSLPLSETVQAEPTLAEALLAHGVMPSDFEEAYMASEGDETVLRALLTDRIIEEGATARERLLEWVRRNGGTPAPVSAIAVAVESGVGNTRNLLGEMIKDGTVIAEGKGRSKAYRLSA